MKIEISPKRIWFFLILLPISVLGQNWSKKIKFNGLYVAEGGNPSYQYYDVLRIYPDSSIVIGQIDRDRLLDIGPNFNEENYTKLKVEISDNKITYQFAPNDSLSEGLARIYTTQVEKRDVHTLVGKKYMEYNGFFNKRKLQFTTRLINEKGLLENVISVKNYTFIKVAKMDEIEVLPKNKEVFVIVDNPPAFKYGEEAEKIFFDGPAFKFKIRRGNLLYGKYINWSYVVEKDGSVSTIRLDSGYSERVFEGLKKALLGKQLYFPAKHGGKPVRFRKTKIFKFTPN